MDQLNRVTQAIYNGMYNACEINCRFQHFDYPDLKPEYLLTYNIAEALHREFPENRIILECPSEDFKDSAIPKKADIFKAWDYWRNKIFFKGRIDIVLFEEDSVLCPIEIKLVNPQKLRIKKDFMRLMACLDKVTEYNGVQFGIFAYVIKPQLCLTREEINDHVHKAIQSAKKFIDDHFGDAEPDFEFVVEGQNIYDNLNRSEADIEGMNPQDVGDLLKESVQLTGIIIKISCKKIA